MSAPACTPPKLTPCELLHLVRAVFTGAPPAVGVVTNDDVDVVLKFSTPPTPRAQTPPPGWFGRGFGGADTKALPCCVRNAVVTLPMALEIVAAVAAVGTAKSPTLAIGVPVCTGTVHCANAPDDPATVAIRAAAAKSKRRCPA